MKNIIIGFVLFIAGNVFSQNVQLSYEMVWAERISATQYLIKNNSKKTWKIYTGTDPQNINYSTQKMLKDSLKFEVLASERLYFSAVSKKDTVVFSERRLWFDNAPNFRDLGGLKTDDGKTISWGKLFRCGDMGMLSERDLTILKRENIKNVIDFRNEREIKTSPDRYPSDHAINRVWTSISPENGSGMSAFYALISNPNSTAQDADSIFESFYLKMHENIKNYGPFFKTLLEAGDNEASLFHCTAGKDRTGFGSALLLSVLGVSDQDIEEEYYLSNRYFTYKSGASTLASMKEEIAKVMAGVQPKYIKVALKGVKDKYGSVNAMLEKELGIDASDRAKLKHMYTN